MIIIDALLLDDAIPNNILMMLNERVQLGLDRYGERLRTNNKRDSVKDLKEEILDAIFYNKQAELEGKITLGPSIQSLLISCLELIENEETKNAVL